MRVGTLMTDYRLTRSKRKTVAIYVRDGYVDVRAPLQMARQDIDRFVESKQKWINEKLAVAVARMENRKSFSLSYGDQVYYRGRKYPIVEKPGDRIGFDDAGFYMPPGLTPGQIKHSCIRIYRLLAKRDLIGITLKYAKEMSLFPAAIKINSAKTRWGSCSTQGSINYSWRLIIAQDDVIEYIVVHELAHMLEPNHSPRFWSTVGEVLPDYEERQAKLRKLQHKLNNEDWD